MSARSNAEAMAAWRVLRAMRGRGFELFPLKRWDAVRQDGEPVGKAPLHFGWRTKNYDDWDFPAWLRQGGNIGVRLRACDLVVDVDPRNGGEDSIASLELLYSLTSPMRVTSGRGDGGYHLYLRKPADILTVGKLKSMPGVDFKSIGGYVVAPGSLHPATGQPYTPGAGLEPGEAGPELLEALRRPPPRVRTGAGGELTLPELQAFLAVLDPARYREYDDWIVITAACHDATCGDGFNIWADWCRSDPEYAGESYEKLESHWDSFEAGRSGGVTYRTILRAVIDAGHRNIVFDRNTLDFDDEVARELAAPIVDDSERRRLAPFRGD